MKRWLMLLTAGCIYAQTVQYEYDTAGRLVKATYLDGRRIVYVYDASGNLLSREVIAFSHQDDRTRWIPHITRAGGLFETSLIFTNFGGSRAEISLQPYTQAGSPLPPATVEVLADRFVVKTIEDVFGSTFVSHFSISGNNRIRVTAAYRQATGLGATAHVNETSLSATEYAILPGEWPFVFDGLALVNRESQAAEVSLEQIVSQSGQKKHIATKRFTVEPYAKQLLVIGDQFEDIPDAQFRVHSSRQSALVMLRGSYPGTNPGYLYQTVPIVPYTNAPSTRIIPHVTPPGSPFTTTVFITNFSDLEEQADLEPFSTDGSPLAPRRLAIPANGFISVTTQDLFDGLGSHFRVETERSVIVSVGYRIASGQGATAHVSETSFPLTQSQTPFIVYQGEWDAIFDGLALVNFGPQSAEVRAVQVKSDGTRSTIDLTSNLAPLTKYLLVFDTAIQDFAPSQIRVFSNQPASAVLLRGTRPGVIPGYLYQTETIPLQNQ